MTVSINPPKTPITAGSNGVAAATVPNVCKMPGPPAPFVPTPLPNIARSGIAPKGYSKGVKIEGKKVAIRGATFGSTGDIASKATGGGIVSANTQGPIKFLGPGSMNVKIEGKNVQLLGDPVLNNCGPSGAPANAATMVGVLQKSGLAALWGDELCPLCNKEHGEDGKLTETPDTKKDAGTFTSTIARVVAVEQKKANAIAAAQRAEANKKHLEDYDKKMISFGQQLAKAQGKPAAEASIKAAMAKLRPKQSKLEPPKVTVSTMVGIVRCEHGDVFAANSRLQFHEVVEAMPSGWHTFPGARSVVGAGRGDPPGPERYMPLVGDHEAFMGAWEKLTEANWSFREALSREEDPEPFYPPGHCAAPQVIALALAHGARPAGLTERWHKTNEATASVRVMVRDTPSSPPRMDSFCGEQAVPPCGSCQVLLTMLMCPELRGPECEHQTPDSPCRCNC